MLVFKIGFQKTSYFLLVILSCVSCKVTLNINEGSPCYWEDYKGLCVSIYQCLSAAINIKDGGPPPMCTSEVTKPPIVCCTDCNLVKDIRNYIFDNRLGVYEKPKIKSELYCLQTLHKFDYPCKRRTNVSIHRTVNNHIGENCTTIKRYTSQRTVFYAPYAWKEELTNLAMLGYGTVEATLQWLCGGSLISDRFVLTAAHCVVYNADIGRVTHIGVGEHHGSYEHWHQYRVTVTTTHPKYKPPAVYHDIALLETEMPVLFQFWVLPACLPHENDFNDTKAMATAIGNYTEPQNKFMGSYFVQLNKFGERDCKTLFPPSRALPDGFDAVTQLCYGYRNRKDVPCGSDRGAPLQKRHTKYPCGVSIIGVTSLERSCKYRVGFGLYTNVSYYLSWIESVVWPSNII